MIVDIILPYKELFSPNKASAVSLTVHNSAQFSNYKSSIRVFGQHTDSPFKDIQYIGIKTNRILHLGNNKSILINYIKLINLEIEKHTNVKRIIEIHNRPYLFNLAIKKIFSLPISLHFHNDPRDMKGSKTPKQRVNIASKASAVYFVSQYIKNCFLEGINQSFENLHVLPNAIERKLINKPIKRKEIIFVGRLVPEKGCHIYIDAIRKLVLKYPDWNFKIIGANKAGQINLKTNYEKKIIKDFESLGSNVKYLGFIKNDKVQLYLQKSSILVIPSIWQEPSGLIALEGLANANAIIASKVGGMAEILEDVGILISNINAIKLHNQIESLIQNPDILKDYQNKSWINYQYNQRDMVKLQDKFRNNIFNKNYN